MTFDRFAVSTRSRLGLFLVASAICVVQFALRDLSYYTSEPRYDPAPVMAMSRNIRRGASQLPPIARVSLPEEPANLKKGAMPVPPNDGFMMGLSPLPCYEPSFGYSLELFPAPKLIETVQSGAVHSIVDPRCYLAGGSHGCRPGDLFPMELDQAAFVNHRPLNWDRPPWAKWSHALTLFSLLLAILVFGGYSLRAIFERCKR